MVMLESACNEDAFGPLLRQYRESAGLGQARLAERAGLSVPAISNLERGVNRPRLETVTLLAEALAATEEQRAALIAAARPERAAPETYTPSSLPPTRRHNLSVAPTPLVGRGHEVAALRARLQDPALRLLTLTGVGGAGKTRLALAVGAAELDHYPDGVWLVELAPLTGPALVPSAVAAALGLREEADQPLLATLTDQLREKRLLLVLDNCEHLLAACADLASTLLRCCPNLSILATSREGLKVDGEQVYAVPPLSVPNLRHLPPLELVGGYEAVRLFVARAQARRHEFTLSTHNARAVAEVCARLDGLPLAIELAAARVTSLSVEAIDERLDTRFRLLTGGPRDVSPRQRTLRATMDWSWELLDEPERALLRRLSVFAGGWTLPAAEAVAATQDGGTWSVAAGDGATAWAVLDLLDELAAKSLLGLDESGTEARYGLLETVRAYAAERLDEAGESTAVRDRHLDWCLALAEEAAAHLLGPEQGAWLARVEREHDNLRAALSWARARGAGETGLRLAGALCRFWYMRGHLGEGREWLETMLAAPASGDHGPGELGATERGAGTATGSERAGASALEARARVLNGAGMLAQLHGEHQRAATRFEESLALYRDLGDTRGMAAVLNSLGNLAIAQGNHERACPLFEQSLALFRALGTTEGIAAALNNLGLVAQRRGEYARSAAFHEESLAVQRKRRDEVGMALTLGNLGLLARDQGDAERAETLHMQSLALRQKLGDRMGVALALNNLGLVASDRGDYARAATFFAESLALRRELGDQDGQVMTFSNWADLARYQGDEVRAVTLYRQSLALGQALGHEQDMTIVAACLEGLAAIIAPRRHGAATAARLWGAAEVIRVAGRAPLPPVDRPRYERAVLEARAAMDDETFEEAWAAGRELPLDEAIAEALAAGAPPRRSHHATR